MFSIVRCVRLDSSFLRTLFVSLLGSTAFSFPFVIGASAVDDLPSGGSVISGQATIGGAGNNMLITQSSENAIINWDGFSIGAGNNVAFQNGSGATLNRVIGTDISTINGGLTATGSLFLINQNGVIIGEHGVIETGGSFIASTLDVANEDFLNGGDLHFSGDLKASVINLGKVSSLGGDVSFIAHAIVNEGAISAPNGTAALVAGREVLMRDGALDDGKFVVKLGDATSSVTEAGMIAAASVELRANGGNIYALAGNKGGAINATGVSSSGGRIFLTAPGGKVRVNKQIKATRNTGAGGDIFINADIVSVANLLDVTSVTGQGGNIDIGASDTITLEGATLDASGYTGGGRIRVGGEYQGGKGLTEDEVQNAQTLLIDELTTLKANGTGDNADGGTIIMWADVDTTFNGNASATATGTGGFVETSAAHLHIGNNARVTTLSEAGAAGKWLLDPVDFIVAATGGNITGAALSGNLDGGDIEIMTSAGAGNGDLFINDDVSWSSDTTLTLTAHHDVAINADVTATGADAGLVVTYDTDATDGAYIFSADGRVTLSGASAELTINGENYTLIHDVDQLQDMDLDLTGHYALAVDIDASATAGWSGGFRPIGDYPIGFTGDFNGQGHTITDLVINRPALSYVGLFERTNNANISNVGMVGGAVRGNNYVGGLAGAASGSSIINVYTTGTVTGNGSSVGGLVGTMSGSSIITNSYASGAVTGHSEYVGGLVGAVAYSSISNSYATGAVSGDDFRVGGLVGQLFQSNLEKSYATGTVRGYSTQVGGLVGSMSFSGITNSYASGAVTGNGGNVGGLVGLQYGGDVQNSLWDTSTTGQSNAFGGVENGGISSGIISLSATDAFDASKYVGWNIGTTIGNSVPAGDWLMIDGETRPFLASEYSTQIANAHQLQLMAFDLDADYTLVADIDATQTDGATHTSQWGSTRGFAPIGDDAISFTGSFDGQGHVISDLAIDRPDTDYVGLFGYTDDATITNVGLIDSEVTGSNSVGALIGHMFAGDVTNAYATGGAVESQLYNAGGLIGSSEGGGITYAYADVKVKGTYAVGGLVGSQQSSSITNAYATGNVNGHTYVGGLVGARDAGSITNAYATGIVTGDTEVGGLVGNTSGGGISSSFWDTETTGVGVGVGSGSPDGTTGLTTAEFQNSADFMSRAAGWDFENVWAPPSAGYYPELYALSEVVWVKTDDVSRDYGDANPALTVAGIYGGPDIYVFGPTGDVLDFTPTLSSSAGAGSNVGTYGITGSPDPAISDKGREYRVVYSGELEVTPASLTITAADDTKTYNGQPYAGGNGVSYAGFVNGEGAGALNGALGYGGTAQGAVDPQKYTITPEGLASGNYTITFVDGTLTLFPTPGMQTDVSSFADDGNGFGQNFVCADEELLNCDLVEAQF